MINWTGRRIFLFGQEIDMRSGWESLSNVVRGLMKKNIMEGDLYLFLGKNARRVKVLLFDGTGLVLVSKRLEKGCFQRLADFDDRREIALEQLELIFQGTRINFAFQRKDFSLAAPGLLIPS
jgi:transposase